MSEFSSWSLYCGRWFRLHVRVHSTFILVAVFAMLLSTSRPAAEEAAGYGALGIGILLLSVLAHELGHCFAAVRVGGSPEQIMIGPLGGLLPAETPREPQPELITASAGPLVNLGILLLVMPMVWASGGQLMGLVSPFTPDKLIEGPWWVVALRLTFWVNWLLLVVNLLPAFPLDGARILRSLLLPALDYRSATQVAIRTSKLTALGVCILAYAIHDPKAQLILPTWVPLVLFALFIYLSAQQEAARLDDGQWDEDLSSYDFSQGYTSLERTLELPGRQGSPMKRWLDKRRDVRRRRREMTEQDEERQVDEILLRLHESGMQGLTSKERALLNRVSARYRNRQSN